MTTTERDEELREEFHRLYKVTDDETGEFIQYAERSDGKSIADYWLSKIATEREEARKEEKKRIEAVVIKQRDLVVGKTALDKVGEFTGYQKILALLNPPQE